MASLPTSQFSNLIRTDFWFIDGNIILIAQNAAFKVHKGQLARHSEVFSDLFSLPQPSPTSLSIRQSRASVEHGKEDAVGKDDWDMEKGCVDLIDGCPFVVLQDSPSDVFYFLSALYDGLYFAPSIVHCRPHPPSFSALSAVLRLSSKYLVEPLVQRCLFHLSLDWPVTLAGWDEREARFTLDASALPPPKNVGRNHPNRRYVPREFCPHPILIIQFALEMNLPDILPAAMYDLSRYGPSKITNGTSASSTTFDRLVAQLTNLSASRGLDSPKPVRLSPDLLFQTLRGREESQRFVASFIERELYSRPPSPSCHNLSSASPTIPSTPPTQPNAQGAASIPPASSSPSPIETQDNPCGDSFYFILLNVLRSIGGVSYGRDADAFFTLTQASEMLDRTDYHVSGLLGGSAGAGSDRANQRTFGLNVCQACKQEFRESVKKAREEMWSYLPRWFGLVESLETEPEAPRV